MSAATTRDEPAVATADLGVIGMTCAACVRRIEKAVGAVDGVQGTEVNLATHRARVSYVPGRTSVDALARAIEGAGYQAVRPDVTAGDPAGAQAAALEEAEAREERALRRDLALTALLGVPLLIVGMSHGLMAWTETPLGRWLQLALATPVLLGPGRRFFRLAWTALRHRTADMNTLVATGSGAAWLYSTVALVAPGLFPHAEHGRVPHLYFEASAAIVGFVLFGKVLETRARKQLSGAVRGLVALQPTVARRVAEGREEDVPVSALSPGDRVLVRPGERLPADGEVVSGRAAVDESLVTGESLPVDKAPGDAVHGGTLAQGGALTVRVTAAGKGSALARIVQAVEQAQGSKAPIARLADRVSAIFVPVVLGIALVTFFVWWAVDPSAMGLSVAVERFVAVLVIACPCALGLATPAAVAVGTSRGAELGVLVKGGAALEAASRVDRVLLDKTGTLTTGRPALTDVIDRSGLGEDALLALVARAERSSEHPLARAVVDGALARALDLGAVDAFWSVAGAGVEASVDGMRVRVGTAAWMQDGGADPSALEADAERLAAHGRTPFFVAVDGVLAGLVAVADPPAPDAMATLRELRELGVEVAMLTGDRARTARAVADALGIHDVFAGLRPEDKARIVAEERARGRVVAMVGDGLNDAPALAGAHVGVAIGTGTDVAIAASDVALLRGGIRALPRALRLARATLRTIRQNLFWAFVYNTLGIPIAAGLLYPFTGWLLSPVLASAAMSLSSVSVILSSLRLRRFEAA